MRRLPKCKSSCMDGVGISGGRSGNKGASCNATGIGTRTAKIAVDDAVLLHKFSSKISVDKFLAEIPFPQLHRKKVRK